MPGNSSSFLLISSVARCCPSSPSASAKEDMEAKGCENLEDSSLRRKREELGSGFKGLRKRDSFLGNAKRCLGRW